MGEGGGWRSRERDAWRALRWTERETADARDYTKLDTLSALTRTIEPLYIAPFLGTFQNLHSGKPVFRKKKLGITEV